MSESERVALFHCPYCGDEDLRPQETRQETQGAWGCRSCRRVFTVRFIGLWQEAQSQEAQSQEAQSQEAQSQEAPWQEANA